MIKKPGINKISSNGNPNNLVKYIKIDSSESIFWSLVDHRSIDKQKETHINNEDIAKMNLIIDEVCNKTNHNKKDILGTSTKHKDVLPRHIVYYLINEYLFDISEVIVAKYMGGKSKTSIFSGQNKIKNLLTNKNFEYEGKLLIKMVFELEVKILQQIYNISSEDAKKQIIGKYEFLKIETSLIKSASNPVSGPKNNEVGYLLEKKYPKLSKFQDIKKELGTKIYKDLHIDYLWSLEAFAGISDEDAVEHIRYIFLTNKSNNLFDLWRKEIFYNNSIFSYIKFHKILFLDKRLNQIKIMLDNINTDIVLNKIASIFNLNESDIFPNSAGNEDDYESDYDDDYESESDYDDEIQKYKINKLKIKAAKRAYNFVIENYLDISKTSPEYDEDRRISEEFIGRFKALDIWSRKFFLIDS